MAVWVLPSAHDPSPKLLSLMVSVSCRNPWRTPVTSVVVCGDGVRLAKVGAGAIEVEHGPSPPVEDNLADSSFSGLFMTLPCAYW